MASANCRVKKQQESAVLLRLTSIEQDLIDQLCCLFIQVEAFFIERLSGIDEGLVGRGSAVFADRKLRRVTSETQSAEHGTFKTKDLHL